MSVILMELQDRFSEALKEPICDNCLGRCVGNLLSGMTNEQRGRIIRGYMAFLLDSGKKLDVHMPNFHGTRFRELKAETGGHEECRTCNDFFLDKIEEVSRKAAKKLEGMEFSTFLVGSIPTDEMRNREERLWDRVGVDYVEPIKSEINREVGKRVEKIAGKKFDPKDPDIVVTVDLKRGEVRAQVRSLYVSGGYKKLVRGIPQTRWTCTGCGGKGCVECGGEGKRYKTSVHEIVGKPIMKAAGGKDHAFHGSGREDIDARCLDYRPFVLEVVRPTKRGIDLRKVGKTINRSKKVQVSGLEFSDKAHVRKIKADRHDKTYSAEVDFEEAVDRKMLPRLAKLKGAVISQQTPTRVKHRRADILRKRGVKSFTIKLVGRRKARIEVRAEAGMYIKELISGDGGRTRPSVAELLNNKVKRIVLDVTKIHKVR